MVMRQEKASAPKQKPALIIMAKWPEPGEVKTRLTSVLNGEEAAALYQAMLLDVVELCLRIDGVRVFLGYHPVERGEDFARLLPDVEGFIEQRGDHLAARMDECFRRVFLLGYSPVLMRNSDAPTMPDYIVEQALLAHRAGADVTFSPDGSNGFGLIGLSKRVNGLLDKPLETSNSYAEIRRRCEEGGLRVEEVQGWYDVDTPEDLEKLLEDWREREVCRRVLHFLNERGRGAEWERRLARRSQQPSA